METKQTAVMYLLDWLMDNPLPSPDFVNAISKAEELEKEQHKEMFDCGRQYQLTGEGTFTQVQEELYGK